MAYIAPSILSADFAELKKDLETTEASGVKILHYDVIDGVFAPNITMGIPVLKAMRKASGLFIDTHLMIVNPINFVDKFIDAGSDLLDFHVESAPEDRIIECLKRTRLRNVKTGIAIKPGTPASAVVPFLDYTDMILVMTVMPGYSGQSFMPEQLDTVREVKKIIINSGKNIKIQVDGGVNYETAPLLAEAGAEIFVSGSFYFSAPDRREVCEFIKNL